MEQDTLIERLKEKARRLAGGRMQSFGIDDLPKDAAAQFLERIIAFETAPTTTDFDRLTADAVPLPPPEEVPNRAIGVVLWRVIFAAGVTRPHAEEQFLRQWSTEASDCYCRSRVSPPCRGRRSGRCLTRGMIFGVTDG
jgi:hypothetical protein